MRTDDKPRWVHFDPTINTGHVLQIVVLVAGLIMAYSTIKEGMASQKIELDNVKANSAAESQRVKEGLSELKADVKEIAKSMNAVNESLAAIKAQQGHKK